MPRFSRFIAAAALLILMIGVFQATSGCHDDSTGCCRVCTGMCACGDNCIDCTTKCMMGSGCACNSSLPPAAPDQAAAVHAPMSESADAGG